MKAQWIRALDVLFIGPATVYLAANADNVPDWGKRVMVLVGIATIVYNGLNYSEMEGMTRNEHVQ